MMRNLMVHWLRYAPFVAACVLLLLATGGQPAIGKSHGEQTIVGDVSIEEQNDDGEVVSVSIFDNSWGSVIVSPAGKGRELLSYVGDVVEASGEIHDTDEGEYIIDVKSYRIMESDEPDFDSDEEDEEG